MTKPDIYEEALALPEAARADLALKLLDSLDEREPRPGHDEAWADEITRRLKEYDDGLVEAVDARTAIQDLRTELRDRR